MILDDTIAAVASPPGQGAVAIVRVSGPHAVSAVDRCWRAASGRPLAGTAPRTVRLGEIVAADGSVVDQVLAVRFAAPASFTGEDVVEITCHGGVLVTRLVLERLVDAPAVRPAQPGEFSQRAFLNGKLDLTQAEGIMDVIGAQTALALRAANEQLAGRLGDGMRRIREELLGTVAHLEAYIDFPEEDIDPQTGAALAARIEAVRGEVDRWLRTAEQGRMLREGVRTVIAGAPNVGKSSLLNLLLGFDRAIVSEIPGTTRDTIEEVVNVGGFPLRLIDTAGLRETTDAIEREGIERARRQVESADLMLEVVDGSLAQPAGFAPPASEHRLHLLVLNKADLPLHPSWGQAEGVRLSCLTGEGRETLVTGIHDLLAAKGGGWEEGGIAINARHRHCLGRARADLDNALQEFAAGSPPEIVAVGLRAALDAVGDVIGKVDVEDILGHIFASFCIGK